MIKNMDIVKELDKHGVVVVPKVLARDEVEHAKKLFWDKLESLGSGIQRDNPDTWNEANWPGDIFRGFMTSHGISQSEAAWYLRSHRRIRRAFEQIWETRDLITSMDAFICWRPWNKVREPKDGFQEPCVEGFHVDQSPKKRGFHCVQGMIVLNEVTDESGGLRVIRGTHTDRVQDYIEKKYKAYGDWCELRNEDPLVKFSDWELLKAQPGDLILWDSRLIHSGYVGTGYDDRSQVKDLARLCMAVCMVPRDMVSPEVLEQRRKFFERGKATTHWPNKCEDNTVFDSYGSNIPDDIFSPPNLDRDVMSLIY